VVAHRTFGEVEGGASPSRSVSFFLRRHFADGKVAQVLDLCYFTVKHISLTHAPWNAKRRRKKAASASIMPVAMQGVVGGIGVGGTGVTVGVRVGGCAEGVSVGGCGDGVGVSVGDGVDEGVAEEEAACAS
jgi:hypothetical protein